MKKLIDKIKHINFRNRFIIYSFLVCILMIFSFSFLKVYSSYNSSASINTNVEKAVYILDEEELSFNIDIDGIIPSNKPYIYSFSVANYNDKKQSNVDLEYSIDFRTTTNLPLQYELYRNEDYSDDNSNNLLSNGVLIQDEDGSWYNTFSLNNTYTFNYKEKVKDIYYLVVNYPKNYENNIEYADLLDVIEVKIDAKQIID